jgi:uncharacterized membrane protein
MIILGLLLIIPNCPFCCISQTMIFSNYYDYFGVIILNTQLSICSISQTKQKGCVVTHTCGLAIYTHLKSILRQNKKKEEEEEELLLLLLLLLWKLKYNFTMQKLVLLISSNNTSLKETKILQNIMIIKTSIIYN